MTCSGGNTKDCYTYFVSNNSWAFYLAANHSYWPYAVYQNKFYMSSYEATFQEVLDLETKVWSTWPLPPFNFRYACQVIWRDSFLRFGGNDNHTAVTMFNHTTQTWLVLDTPVAPMAFFRTGCALLPGDKVLLMGSALNTKTYTIYDILANNWTFTGTLSYDLSDISVVSLGKRMFIIPGSILLGTVREFHVSNYSLTDAPVGLSQSRGLALAVVSVPARWFPNCIGIF